VDWIVASWLANQGVMNGYLSAVQDEWLTGYASAAAPRRDAPQGDPTMIALREITDVSPRVVHWFEEEYGEARRASLAEAVRRTLLAPLPRVDVRTTSSTGVSAWSTTMRALRTSHEASAGWSCQLSSPALSRTDREVLRRAMETAADARVRGLTKRWGDYAAKSPASWRLRSLGGAPWNPAVGDSVTIELRNALLWRATRVDDGQPGADFVERAERTAARDACTRGGRVDE
jgi:hypothetical protein